MTERQTDRVYSQAFIEHFMCQFYQNRYKDGIFRNIESNVNRKLTFVSKKNIPLFVNHLDTILFLASYYRI